MKLSLVLSAKGFKSKIKLSIWFVLDSLPRFIVQRSRCIIQKILTDIKESLTKNVIIKVNYGVFQCIDSASVLVVSPLYERSVVELLTNKLHNNINDVFIDVGAHIGKYTILAAKIAQEGLIIALEPHPANYKLLLKNIRLNELQNVITLNVAAWNKDCIMKLFVGKNSETHSLARKAHENVTEKYFYVKAFKLDNVVKKLGLRRIDWVKIDVEGGEIEVLEGMSDILRKYKPRLIVEVFKYNYRRFAELLKSCHYKFTPIIEYENHGYYYVEPAK